MSKNNIMTGVSLASGWLLAVSTAVSAAQPISTQTQSSQSLKMNAPLAKHVMAPPQEMAKQQLRTPSENGVFSHSTMLRVNFVESNSGSATLNATTGSLNAKTNGSASNAKQSFATKIFFDGEKDSPMVLLAPDANQWALDVKDANGVFIYKDSESARVNARDEKVSIGNQSFNGRQFILKTPAVGEWQVNIENKAINQKQSKGGFLLFKGDPNYKLYSYRDNNFSTQDSDVNLVAYLVDATGSEFQRNRLVAKNALSSSVERAYVEVTSPSGKVTKLKMNDRGILGDEVAGDGKFSAKLPTAFSGVYKTQVYIEGFRPDGIRYSRTAADLYPVEKISHTLSAKAGSIESSANNQSDIVIPVNVHQQDQNIFVSGDIYATDKTGKLQPAAWLGGVSKTENISGTDVLKLKFDARWLTRKKLQAPIEIQNLRFQHATTHVPLVEYQNFSLSVGKDLSGKLANIANDNLRLKVADNDSYDIDASMLAANGPSDLGSLNRATSNPKLMLVHGYCSGDVWNASEFSNAVEFQDFNKNRSHEDFANRILSFGSAYTSYGIVAHSQGGAAALHLYSRYWSGLDYASGGRIIQSVGTPYQGTSLAGNLALIGDIFGAGCGTNTDLTYSGASNWLSTIPSWARAEVDYYTTSFNTRWWAYDYCHLATDLFLDDPEDGTTEKWSGQLSGAANKGHKKGWCHTGGMRDPAQYRDGSRNASMNSRAAR